MPRPRPPRRREVRSVNVGYPPSRIAPYDPKDYPEDELDRDTVIGVLGPAIDGWLFELVYRYAIYKGFNVDWAIMIFALRAGEVAPAERRKVLRIDICHSEVHRHIFKQSSNPADDQGRRETIMSLSSGDGAKVNSQWENQMNLVSQTWQQRAREWIDG